MGRAAARQGDRIVNAADIHVVMVPSPGGPVPTPQPFPFDGPISTSTSPNVRINGRCAATVGATAWNLSPHVPAAGAFQTPPGQLGRIVQGSATVRINGRAAARHGDPCETCHDLPPAGAQSPTPSVVVQGQPDVAIG